MRQTSSVSFGAFLNLETSSGLLGDRETDLFGTFVLLREVTGKMPVPLWWGAGGRGHRQGAGVTLGRGAQRAERMERARWASRWIWDLRASRESKRTSSRMRVMKRTSRVRP
jgi:hypothetical protein